MLQKLSKLTKTSVINPTKSIVFIFWNIFYHPMMKITARIICTEPARQSPRFPCTDIKPQLFIYNGRDLVLIIFFFSHYGTSNNISVQCLTANSSWLTNTYLNRRFKIDQFLNGPRTIKFSLLSFNLNLVCLVTVISFTE